MGNILCVQYTASQYLWSWPLSRRVTVSGRSRFKSSRFIYTLLSVRVGFGLERWSEVRFQRDFLN